MTKLLNIDTLSAAPFKWAAVILAKQAKLYQRREADACGQEPEIMMSLALQFAGGAAGAGLNDAQRMIAWVHPVSAFLATQFPNTERSAAEGFMRALFLELEASANEH